MQHWDWQKNCLPSQSILSHKPKLVGCNERHKPISSQTDLNKKWHVYHHILPFKSRHWDSKGRPTSRSNGVLRPWRCAVHGGIAAGTLQGGMAGGVVGGLQCRRAFLQLSDGRCQLHAILLHLHVTRKRVNTDANSVVPKHPPCLDFFLFLWVVMDKFMLHRHLVTFLKHSVVHSKAT